jgi:hypothetical protein
MPVSALSRPEPPVAPAPVEVAPVAAAPGIEVERPAVALLRPSHRTHIEPVAKGVYQLVTVAGEDTPAGEGAPVHRIPSAIPAPVAAPAILSASFEMPAVVEAMPAVLAVPVSAVEEEPLVVLERLEPAAGPVPAGVAIPPVSAGIIRVAASSRDVPAAAPVAPETAPAIESGEARLADALIEVSNGSGIERSGARFRAYLKDQGVPVRRLTNDARFGHSQTILFYKHGFLEAAQAIASELPMPIALERDDRQRSDLRLRLGLDSKPFDNYLSAGIITASR